MPVTLRKIVAIGENLRMWYNTQYNIITVEIVDGTRRLTAWIDVEDLAAALRELGVTICTDKNNTASKQAKSDKNHSDHG